MSKILSITTMDDKFRSATILKDDNTLSHYDMFMVDGDTWKHENGDDDGVHVNGSHINIDNNSLGESTIWISPDYTFTIGEKSSPECIAPTINQSPEDIPMSMDNFERLCEGDDYMYEVDVMICKEGLTAVDNDDKLHTIFSTLLTEKSTKDTSFEDSYDAGTSVTYRFNRDENGFADEANEIIRSTIEEFEEKEEATAQITFQN